MNDFLASFKNRQENSNTKSDNVDQRLIEISALIAGTHGKNDAR